MRRIREILRLREGFGYSERRIQRSTGVARTTIRECLQRAKRAEISYADACELDDEELQRRLYPPPKQATSRPEPDWAEMARELKRPGVTRRLLWLEYKEAHPEGYEYSWFCAHLKRYEQTLDVVMRFDHAAGERLFVDWAGQQMEVIDPHTGEVHEVPVFVATLGASSYTYAVAKPSAELAYWIEAHVEALEFIGGVPQAITPDNTKTAVSKADHYDPELNPSYAEFARHYATTVLPTRTGKPRDKAKVEAAVRAVEHWVLAPLRDRQFFSLAELNAALAAKLAELNERGFQKLDGSRRSWFFELERDALKPLPPSRYELAYYKKATVHKDYHVELERHYYSVPHRYVGKRVELRYTQRTVEIYHQGKRIASHLRSFTRGRHTTVLEHMPEHHRDYCDWPPERFRRWACKIGPSTDALIGRILEAGEHPVQGYRRCFGILKLARTYGDQRLEAAAERALASNLLSVRSVTSILETGLDRKPLDQPQPSLPNLDHSNVRGPDYYH